MAKSLHTVAFTNSLLPPTVCGKRKVCSLASGGYILQIKSKTFRSIFTLDWCTHTVDHRPVHKQALRNKGLFSYFLLSSHQFDCCGVNSPEDFKDSLFREINQNHMVPEACCQRASQTGELAYITQEQCLSGNMMFRNNKVTSDICHDILLLPLSFSLSFQTTSGFNQSRRQLRGDIQGLADSSMADQCFSMFWMSWEGHLIMCYNMETPVYVCI